MVNSINSFIYRFAQDFQSLEAKKIIEWYRYPVSIDSPEKKTIIINEAQAWDVFNSVCRCYKSFGVERMYIVKNKIYPYLNDFYQINLDWIFVGNKLEKEYKFSSSYFLCTAHDRVKICACYTNNTLYSQWQRSNFF